jgi:hypothetical protein
MKTTPDDKKRRLVADLAGARQEVLSAAIALPPEDQDTPFLGTWSAHDIVAHLIGWDYANLEAIEAVRAGRLPAFYGEYDRDWRTFNAGLVARHEQETLERTASVAETSHQALRSALIAIPAKDISHDYGVRSPGRRRVTIAMLMAAEARDEHKHAEQIREFATQTEARTPGTVP